jgi:Fur family ferric uptake transcriptional regulator
MQDVKQELQESGLKVTRQRSDVLGCFFELQQRHLSAYDIHKYLLNKDSKISLSTVYRIITQFTDVGLLNKLTLDEERSVFELAADKEHHDHIICESCGVIIEFHNEQIERLQEEIAVQYNVTITGHTHILYCKCNKCASSQANTSS